MLFYPKVADSANHGSSQAQDGGGGGSTLCVLTGDGRPGFRYAQDRRLGTGSPICCSRHVKNWGNLL